MVGGVSGAGKSVVLEEGVAAVRGERYVGGIYEVMWSDPLSVVLLDRLSEVVVAVAAETGALDQIGQRLAGAIERMVETRGRDLAHAAGREMLNFVRGRLGPEAGKAIADAVTALQEESAQTLGARLDRARDQTQRELLVDFFGEIVAICDGRPVLIALDRCERLDEKGIRLLADLTEVLPDGCQLWVALKTDQREGQFLATTAASVIDVPPLDRDAIAELLARRELPAADVNEVLERTGGVALDVQAYLGLLESGEQQQPEEVGDEILASDTARAMAALSPRERDLALRLAALSDPLPERYLAQLAGGDPVLLQRTMEKLHGAGMLTSHAGGEWFHERRGAAILAGAKPSERASALADTATAVWEYVRQGGAERWLVELSNLAARAENWDLADDGVSAVLAFDEGGLAIIAGLFELGEKDQPLDGQQLLSYVRATYPTDARELEHLQEVSKANIAVMATNSQTALVMLNASPLTQAIAYGRIVRELGQVPLRSIATVAFEHVLLPRLQPFTIGEYGVGFPSLEALSDMALGTPEQTLYGAPTSARHDAGPAVIVRGSFAGRPLYGAFRFDDERQRDRALDAVSDLDVEFLDSRVAISSAVAYPIGVVPANRFLRAASRIVSREFSSGVRNATANLDPPLTYEKFAELRVRARRVLRDLCGATMRGALRLDRPLSLHWVADDSRALMIEVSGGREIARPHESEALARAAWDGGPFMTFKLESELGLRPDESVTGFRQHAFAAPEYGPARTDPVLGEIDDRQKAATAYNRAQPPLQVRLDDSLAGLIRESFLREMADARALAAELPFLGRDDWEVPATAKYVVFQPPTRAVDGSFDVEGMLMWAEMPSASGEDKCHVAFNQGCGERVPSGESLLSIDTETLALLPGLDLDAVVRSGITEQSRGVAELLGYDENDVDLLPPEGDS